MSLADIKVDLWNYFKSREIEGFRLISLKDSATSYDMHFWFQNYNTKTKKNAFQLTIAGDDLICMGYFELIKYIESKVTDIANSCEELVAEKNRVLFWDFVEQGPEVVK